VVGCNQVQAQGVIPGKNRSGIVDLPDLFEKIKNTLTSFLFQIKFIFLFQGRKADLELVIMLSHDWFEETRTLGWFKLLLDVVFLGGSQLSHLRCSSGRVNIHWILILQHFGIRRH